jgi:hypothetical protein
MVYYLPLFAVTTYFTCSVILITFELLYYFSEQNPRYFTWSALYHHHINGGTRPPAIEFFAEGPTGWMSDADIKTVPRPRTHEYTFMHAYFVEAKKNRAFPWEIAKFIELQEAELQSLRSLVNIIRFTTWSISATCIKWTYWYTYAVSNLTRKLFFALIGSFVGFVIYFLLWYYITDAANISPRGFHRIPLQPPYVPSYPAPVFDWYVWIQDRWAFSVFGWELFKYSSKVLFECRRALIFGFRT